MSQGVLYIDPSYNQSKFRSEYRIPQQNGIYKTNMRLCNVGVQKTNNGSTEYNYLCGSYGVIDSLAIYSGSQLIDQVLHFSEYVAIKNLLHSNTENQSIHKPLAHHKLGYVSAGLDQIDAAGAVTLAVKQSASVPNGYTSVYGADSTSTLQARNGGWLDLKQCLGFLRSSPYLPTNVFPDLRIVVNYKNATLSNQVITIASTLETLEPLLIAEYETDPEVADAMMRNYTGVEFECVEHDQVQLAAQAPAENTTVAQAASYLVKGFNDKYISKCVIVNTPTDQATWTAGASNTKFSNQGSVSQIDWAYQARINGGNIFPQTTYTGKMRRLAQMSDAWGDLNIAFSQNMCFNSQGASAIMQTDIETTTGQLDYTGFMVADVVKELKLNVQRTAVGGTVADALANNGLRQALNLNMFAISRKRVFPSSSGIVIQYI